MSITPENAEAMRQGFKQMNRTMVVPMWQLGLGKLMNMMPKQVGRSLVLVHRGRKSGKVYRTPINYSPDDDSLLVMAGFGAQSDWYRNAITAGEAEVWLPDGWWQVRVEDISEAPDRARLYRQMLGDTGFAASTFEGIDLATVTDAELEERAEHWRLLRLHRVLPLSGGEGGPGEYAWVWVALGVLLLISWRRRGRRG